MTHEIPLETLIRFWAKTTHAPEQYPRSYHPLLCHMTDVAVVTLALWNHVLPRAMKRRIARCFGLSVADTRNSCRVDSWTIVWTKFRRRLLIVQPPKNIHQLYDGTSFAKSATRNPLKKRHTDM
ncbi:MAG: hypothetical protein IPJ07_17585 [Acidobacteria bacterium]|nr:hypothetical protein [Acidobacteriota bacterium]